MIGRYLHLPAVAEQFEQPTATLVRLPGPAYGSDDVAAKNVAGWLGEPHAVESRLETVDGVRQWVHYETITRQQAAVLAAREALTQTLVPHAHTRTCPHPAVIRDLGRQWYGVEFTKDEIQAALLVVMNEVAAR